MNILIITTYYPPDTAIAAVRPYMFAKYLVQRGHKVTVLRSGLVSYTGDNSADYQKQGVRVISYLGEDSPAEKIERGYSVKTQFSGEFGGISSTKNYWLRKLVKKICYDVKASMVGLKILRAKSRFTKQKRTIDALENEHFDVVFATYGELENIYAGKYAAQKFGCKWILDFRDPLARRSGNPYLAYLRWKAVQKKAILSADLCTAVSHGVAEEISVGTGKHVHTLYNGYEDTAAIETGAVSDDILRFAYTGVLYEGRSSAGSLFAVLRQLADEKALDLSKVVFEYAGPHFGMIHEQAKQHHVEEILINRGFVSREIARKIQGHSDIFVVLTWNTTYEKGVLTGKFFEGIRARKPILVLVTGNTPNCELSTLNKEYFFGFCDETCLGPEKLPALKQWIAEAYQQKQNGLAVNYQPKQELFEDFTYQKLTKNLETLMHDMQ